MHARGGLFGIEPDPLPLKEIQWL